MGDASLILDLMTEDVTVLIPFPDEYGTEQRGKAAAEALFRHTSAGLGLKANSTLASPIMVGAGICGFEYVARGVSGRNAIDLPALLVFEERDGKVAALREYWGRNRV